MRGRTVVVGGALTGVLLVAAAAIPIPYVAIGPGVTYDTLGSVDGTEVITFSGNDIPAAAGEDQAGRGHLNMTTISITDQVPLFEALGLWATGRYALAPREDYFPPDKTVEQVQAQDAQAFRDSQSNAEIASLRYLGYPNVVYVGEIPDGSPSSGVLQPQDQIVAIDNTPVTDFAVAAGRPQRYNARPGGRGDGATRRRERHREGDPGQQPGGRQPGVSRCPTC